MLRSGGIGRDKRKIHICLYRRGQLDLGLLRRLFQALKGQLVLAKINALAGFELVGQELDDLVVEILTTEEGVTIGRLHLKHTVTNFEDRHVEGAATKVIDDDQAGFALVQTIGQRGGCWLVDDAKHLKSGDLAGILGGLPLRVVEIGGDSDHRFSDALAEIGFGIFFQLAKNKAGNLARRIFLAVNLYPGIAVLGVGDLVGDQFGKLLGRGVIMTAPDQSLDGKQGLFRVGNCLAFGGLSDQSLFTIGEGNH